MVKKASKFKTHSIGASRVGRKAVEVFKNIGQGVLHGLIFGEEFHGDELT